LTDIYGRSKYPIAILSRLLDVLGEDVAVAYDIGCRFKITAGNSALGPRFAQQRWSFFVNAFHGWSHNRLCQLKNHPLFKTGYGLEDFETCERFFSFLNLTARPLRHSSQFHRRQFLELYMKVNDHDRYQNLGKHLVEDHGTYLTFSGKFLRNNWVQATAILDTNEALLQDLENRLPGDGLHPINRRNFDAYLQDEWDYLNGLEHEPVEEGLAIEYVQALIGLRGAR
jgi:Kyakuja-Dileera-Zisupton transposase